MKIDPRVFITGPFRTCPKCGKQEFGTLSIGIRLTRRCCECWFAQSVQLPALRKTVVYIDQFAISNMMKALNPAAKSHEKVAEDSFWTTLFEKLDRLCKLQLLVCPDSDLHERESLLSAFRAPLKRMYELLSHGVSFDHHEKIRRRQIAVATRAWVHGEQPAYDFDPAKVTSRDLHAWQENLIMTVNLNYDQAWQDGYRNERAAVHDGLKAGFEWCRTAKLDFAAALAREAEAMPRVMCEVHDKWRANTRDILLGKIAMTEADSLPPTAVSRIRDIKEVLGMEGVPEDQTIDKTSEFLASSAFAEIPFHKISCSLWAVICAAAGAGQKEPPDQGTAIDNTLVSVLIPYCDAMFIDNRTRALWNNIPKQFRPLVSTRLFSLNNRDEFLEYLDSIDKSATAEHMKTVREVYGDDCPQPFIEMYKIKKEAE